MLGPHVSEEAARDFAVFLHYAYPVALFLWFIGAQVAAACTLANLRTTPKPYRRSMLIWMQLAIIACYVLEAGILIARSAIRPNWWCGEHNVLYLIPSILIWSVLEILLLEAIQPVWYPYFGCWIVAGVVESLLLALQIAFLDSAEPFNVARLGVECLRMLVFLAMPLLTYCLDGRDKQLVDDTEERAALLGNNRSSQRSEDYGSIAPSDSGSEDSENDPKGRAQMLEKMEKSGNWIAYAKSFKVFLPYVWPSKDRYLQLCMMLVGLCLLLERAIHVLVPYQMGVVVDSLSKNPTTAPWRAVSLLILYRWLDSGSGISWLKNYLWIPVEQFSYREITTAAYNHVMSLSYDFHSDKKTGEIWTTVNQGRSVNNLVQLMLFSVAPMLADMILAFGYFLIFFNAYMALIVAVVCVVYLWATARLSSMRNKVRREINQAMRNEGHVLVETVSSWTTVSYFNRIGYEQNQYLEAVRRFQAAERRWTLGISMVVVVQSIIFTVGLLAASFLAVYDVSSGKRPVGSFVTLLSYWAQLNGPLSFFSNLYRSIMNKLLDAEKLLQLFQTKPTVVDKPNAIELTGVKGEIVFDKVGFAYDPRKPVIEDLSFRVAPGSTVALVGETGGGKTTCLKLLFRFYDVSSGAIRIDGHDIRDVTIKSLRDNLGVVPQDPQLFNDTIMKNLKYANFDATDEEVYAAARAASIHDKIMSFPDGYESKVGERGIRLSGGELQRVAIARAILRNPKIILLDEATSMVDMDTEREIQSGFQELGKNRTMFVIAHRLSTIMHADLIIVIKDGKMIEFGNHEHLLKRQGKYHQLWTRQGKHTSGVDTDILDQSPVATGLAPPLLPTVGQRPGTSTPPESPVDGPSRTGVQSLAPPDDVLTPSASTDNFRAMVNKSASSGTQKSELKPEAKEFIPRSLATVFNDPLLEPKSAVSTDEGQANAPCHPHNTFALSAKSISDAKFSVPKVETTNGRHSRKILAEALSKLATGNSELVSDDATESVNTPGITASQATSAGSASVVGFNIPEGPPIGENESTQDPEKKKRRRVRRRASVISGPAEQKQANLEKHEGYAKDNNSPENHPGSTDVSPVDATLTSGLSSEISKSHSCLRTGSRRTSEGSGPATSEAKQGIRPASSVGDSKSRSKNIKDDAIMQNVTNTDVPCPGSQSTGEGVGAKAGVSHTPGNGKASGRRYWRKPANSNTSQSENHAKLSSSS